MKNIDKLGKEYIEDVLNFSFNMQADKRIANLMLKCIQYGAQLKDEEYKPKYGDDIIVWENPERKVIQQFISFTNDNKVLVTYNINVENIPVHKWSNYEFIK